MGMHLDDYEIQKACGPIVKFIDLLNNWYIRRSRRRFWRSENDGDKLQAYDTLYTVLMKMVHAAAPITPFITEEIFQNLRTDDMQESIHLQLYPEYDETKRDFELEKKMDLTRVTVTMGRSLRAAHSLKTRQPLKAIYLVTRDAASRAILTEMEAIIKEELNVKQVIIRDNEEDLVVYNAKANFKVLGRKLGKQMKEVASMIEGFSMEQIAAILDGGTVELTYSAGTIVIDEQALAVQRTEKENMKVLNEGSLTVGLDSEMTEELLLEGLARDIIRSIQNHRKEIGLEVTDRIVLQVTGDETVAKVMDVFRDYVCSETLATCSEDIEGAQAAEVELSGHDVLLQISKA